MIRTMRGMSRRTPGSPRRKVPPAPAPPQGEPRWLSAEEQRVWRLFLTVNRLLWEKLGQQLQRDAGMPHTYYEVLVQLSEAPGRRLRMSELAERSLSSRSALSHAVDRLEEWGWVERENHPTDRRGQIAWLTDAGFAVLAAAAPGHVTAVRSYLFDALDPNQVRELGAICAAIVDRLRHSDRADAAGEKGDERSAGDGSRGHP